MTALAMYACDSAETLDTNVDEIPPPQNTVGLTPVSIVDQSCDVVRDPTDASVRIGDSSVEEIALASPEPIIGRLGSYNREPGLPSTVQFDLD